MRFALAFGTNNISYYILEKDQSFLDWLGDILEQVLEIKDGKLIAKNAYIRNESDDEDDYSDEMVPKEIEKMIDVHEHYENKGDRIDIFYGNNRVYLTLRKSEDTRKKLGKFLKKTKTWIDIKEYKKTPNYVKSFSNT